MVSDVYFPRINGVSTSILTFRRELAQLGHEVMLIAPDYGRPGEEGGGEAVRIPSHHLVLDPEDRIMKVGYIRSLATSLVERGLDLVHIQTPFVAHYAGLALGRRLKLPCIATYHTFFEEYLFHYVPLVPKPLMRYAARSFSRSQSDALDALVVPSRAMEQVLHGYGVQTPTCVIPTGIDPADLHGGDGSVFRRRHGIPAHQPMAIYVGRVAFEKNIGFLLHVIHQVRTHLPQVLLVTAGDGPARRHLQKLAIRLGLQDNVRFVGYLARHGELRDCYRAADVFTFASGTETQGLVLLEAMALGVPVVSTAVMGTWDILQAGRGALIARHNVADFAGKLLRVLRDADLRRQLAGEGIAYVQEWTSRAMAMRLAGFYSEVVKGNPGAASDNDPPDGGNPRYQIMDVATTPWAGIGHRSE
jgi:glycosyltransferase involved in cell wall biosynthesis